MSNWVRTLSAVVKGSTVNAIVSCGKSKSEVRESWRMLTEGAGVVAAGYVIPWPIMVCSSEGKRAVVGGALVLEEFI